MCVWIFAAFLASFVIVVCGCLGFELPVKVSGGVLFHMRNEHELVFFKIVYRVFTNIYFK